MPFLCKRGARDTCGVLTVPGRKKKTATSVHPFRHLSHHFLHANTYSTSHIEPPSSRILPRQRPRLQKNATLRNPPANAARENGPKRPKGLRVYKESALSGPSSVNAASHGRWRGGERAQPGTDGHGLRATGGDGRRWATGGGSAGSYIRFRKRVMMPVLMRSTNMAPMMGTMMKGFTV